MFSLMQCFCSGGFKGAKLPLLKQMPSLRGDSPFPVTPKLKLKGFNCDESDVSCMLDVNSPLLSVVFTCFYFWKAYELMFSRVFCVSTGFIFVFMNKGSTWYIKALIPCGGFLLLGALL